MSEAIAAWVPAPILAAVVLAMGAGMWRSFTAQMKAVLDRMDKLEVAIAKLHTFATVDQLSSMGNRFDERIADLRERVRVLESKE